MAVEIAAALIAAGVSVVGSYLVYRSQHAKAQAEQKQATELRLQEAQVDWRNYLTEQLEKCEKGREIDNARHLQTIADLRSMINKLEAQVHELLVDKRKNELAAIHGGRREGDQSG